MLLQTNLFANKPPANAAWDISITVEPTVGEKLSTSATAWTGWKLAVRLGTTVIFDNSVAHKITVSKQIPDLAYFSEQALEIELLSAPILIPGQALKLKIEIEGIDITDVLVDQQIYQLADGSIKYGADVMGEVGIQKLPITTPIYRWLLEHEKLLLRQFSS